MLIKDKLGMDINGLIEHGPITIVAFGDSVTHGILKTTNSYETVYWNVLKQKLNAVRDAIPVNVINAGIGGIDAAKSVARLERDVLSHHPDLVIVCFGLNDVNGTKEAYIEALTTIFSRVLDSGAQVVFLTPNMLNTYVADDVQPQFKEYAAVTAAYQNEGKMDAFMDAAKALAKKMGVLVCDCYAEWKKMYEQGVDTTQLLINRINHPTPEMHRLFADKLFETLLQPEEVRTDLKVDGMYKET